MLGFIGKWRDKIADYIDSNVQLVKLELIERVSKVLSLFAFVIFCLLLLLPVLLFMGMSVAEFCADLMGSRAGGYLLLTGVYALLLFLLYVCRKQVLRRLTDMFINEMTDDEDEKPAKQ
jgi:hypothetical protein